MAKSLKQNVIFMYSTFRDSILVLYTQKILLAITGTVVLIFLLGKKTTPTTLTDVQNCLDAGLAVQQPYRTQILTTVPSH